jgi:hypothetical protein
MSTNGIILSIFLFMAVATTALTIGTSTTFAASTQLMSGDYLPTFAATNGHTQDHHGSPTQYESAQYAWSHPHHHHSSADQNDMIADTSDNKSNNGAGSYGSGSPTQYESAQYESAQYAWSHPHHHHSSADQNDMIADTSDNKSNNGAGSYGSGSPTQYESAQYAWSHPHHHHSSRDMIADINSDNSAWSGTPMP